MLMKCYRQGRIQSLGYGGGGGVSNNFTKYYNKNKKII
jgi:hypothetical protein